MSREDLIAVSQFLNLCFFHRVDAVGGSRQLCGTVSSGLVGWEGPGVVWETRRNITSRDGKPTEKVILVRMLVCKSAVQAPWICWNDLQKTGREGEHKPLLLSDCSYSVSWISFQSFLNCAVSIPILVWESIWILYLTGVFLFSCGPVGEYESQIYSNFPRNSL